MRAPAVAGQFYPSTEDELNSLFSDLFIHPLGAGRIPQYNPEGERLIEGGIVPHAGYVYSGPIASHFYASLAEDGYPDTFVIIGPNHYAAGSGVATTLEDFSTPYGVARIDRELAKSITKELVAVDELAHKYEHSIEVQLPFLQFFKVDIKIVPITMAIQEQVIAEGLGKIIRDAISESGKDVVVIASTDFSHYVPKKKAYKNDALAIERIVNRDISGLYKVIYRKNITMCGYGPVAAMLTATHGKVELLKYATSGDIQPMEEVVGYASFKVNRI